MIYSEQLQTKEWRERREQILLRDAYKCVKCSSADNLHVHHLFYCNGFKAWEYADHCLQTLCKLCHKEAHKKKIEVKFGGIKKNKEHYTKIAYKEKVKKKSDQQKQIDRISKGIQKHNQEISTLINQREFLLGAVVPNKKLIDKNLMDIDKEIIKFINFKISERIRIEQTKDGNNIRLNFNQ